MKTKMQSQELFSHRLFSILIVCLMFGKVIPQTNRDTRIIDLVKNTVNQEFQRQGLVSEPRLVTNPVFTSRRVLPGRQSNRFTSIYMLANFNHEDSKVHTMRETAYVSLSTSKRFISASSISFDTYSKDKRIQDGFKSAFNCTDNPPVTCNPGSRFRTIDGSCNNLRNPRWGMSFTPQARYLPPDYDDGFDSPRTKSFIQGRSLPSARVVSNNVLNGGTSSTQFSKGNTMMLMAWGQFLDHDLTFTPTPSEEGENPIDCCKQSNRDCFPIDIPRNDPHFRKTCMHLIRSSPTLDNPCIPGQRQQVNQLTSFIDASNVYGSTKNQSDALRTKTGGLLKVNENNLPPADKPTICQRKPGDYCMKAGDGRINEVVHLGAVHIVFLRYHNIVANRLSNINPQWDDERIFQEARRIIGALLQKVTYFEFLPILLNPSQMAKHCLDSSPLCKYDPKVNPSIKNSFSTAALRVGHSMVGPSEAYFNADFRSMDNTTDIELTMNKPNFVLFKKGQRLPDLMRFVCSSKSAKTDRIIEPGLRNNLFLDQNGDSLDLGALNIQRGRDHGLPAYIKWRELCGLSRVSSSYFHSGQGGLIHHSLDAIKRLRKTYRHPADIDLFAGALLENPLPGAQVGPTFACILGKQFHDLKIGDRYWFESKDPRTGLSPVQIKSIKKVSLSKIICDAMGSGRVQKNVFQVLNYRNLPERCRKLPDLDLKGWKYNRKTSLYNWRPGAHSYFWN